MCGLAVYNRELVPGTAIVFEVAVETAPGSGTFGSYGEVERVLADPDGWALYMEHMPTDGMRRLMHAFADRPGVTASPPTPGLMVLPGSSLSPVDYPVGVPTDLAFSAVDVVAPDRNTVALIATYTAPGDSQFDHMEYVVSQLLSNGTYSTGQTVVGGKDGSDTVITMPAAADVSGSQYLVTPITVTKGAPASTVIPNLPIGQTRANGPQVQVAVPPLSNAPTLATTTGGGKVTLSIGFDVGTAFLRIYAFDFGTSNPGTVDSVESPDNVVPPDIVPPPAGTSAVRTLSGYTNAHYVGITVVPYSNNTIRGLSTTTVVEVSGSAVPTAPTLAIGTWPGPGGGNWAYPNWVGVKATFVSTPVAGDLLALYRSGTQVGQYAITGTDVSNGFAIIQDQSDSAVYPNTFGYTVQQISLTAGPSAFSSTLNVTMLAPTTLSAPTVSFLSGSGSFGAYIKTAANANNSTPPGSQVQVEYYTYSGADPGGPYIVLGIGPFGATYGVPPVTAPGGGILKARAKVLHANGYTTLKLRHQQHVYRLGALTVADDETEYTEQRSGRERREHPPFSQFWRMAGSPVSVIALAVSLVVSLVTVVRNANGALQSETFYTLRERDSLAAYYRDLSRDQQFLALQRQIADLQAGLSIQQSRDDSLLHMVRREACHRDPQQCL